MNELIFGGVLFRNGSKNVNDAYVGRAGSFSIDLESRNVRVHDGVTPGGAFSVDSSLRMTDDELKQFIGTNLNTLISNDAQLFNSIKQSVSAAVTTYLTAAQITETLQTLAEQAVSEQDYTDVLTAIINNVDSIAGIEVSRLITVDNVNAVDLSDNVSIAALLQNAGITQAQLSTILANYNLTNNTNYNNKINELESSINALATSTGTSTAINDLAADTTAKLAVVTSRIDTTDSNLSDTDLIVDGLATTIEAIQSDILNLENRPDSGVTVQDVNAAISTAMDSTITIGGLTITDIATGTDIATALNSATNVGGISLSDLVTTAEMHAYVSDYIAVALAPDATPTGIGLEPPIISFPPQGFKTASKIIPIDLEQAITTGAAHAATLVQIAKDINFDNIVYNSGWRQGPVLSIVTTEATFVVEDGMLYYVKAWFKTYEGKITGSSQPVSFTYDPLAAVAGTFMTAYSNKIPASAPFNVKFPKNIPINNSAILAIDFKSLYTTTSYLMSPSMLTAVKYLHTLSTVNLSDSNFIIDGPTLEIVGTSVPGRGASAGRYTFLCIDSDNENANVTWVDGTDDTTTLVNYDHNLPGAPDLVITGCLDGVFYNEYVIKTDNGKYLFSTGDTSSYGDIADGYITDTSVNIPYKDNGGYIVSGNTSRFNRYAYKYFIMSLREGDGTKCRIGHYYGNASVKEFNLGWPIEFLMIIDMNGSTTATGVSFFAQGIDVIDTGNFEEPIMARTKSVSSATNRIKFTNNGFALDSDSIMNRLNGSFAFFAVRGDTLIPYIPPIEEMPILSSRAEAVYEDVFRGTSADGNELPMGWDMTRQDAFVVMMGDNSYSNSPLTWVTSDNVGCRKLHQPYSQANNVGIYYPAIAEGGTNGIILTAAEANNSIFSDTYIYAARRSVGYMDIVKYTYNAVDPAFQVNHNLGVKPYVIIMVLNAGTFIRFLDKATDTYHTAKMFNGICTAFDQGGASSLCDENIVWLGKGIDTALGDYTATPGLAILFSEEMAGGALIPQTPEPYTVPTTANPAMVITTSGNYNGQSYAFLSHKNDFSDPNSPSVGPFISNTGTGSSQRYPTQSVSFAFDGTNLNIPYPTTAINMLKYNVAVDSTARNAIIWFNKP